MRATKWVLARRDPLAVLAGLVLPIAVAAALVPLRATFANSAAALVLVAVVVAVAVIGNRAAGFVAAASASLWFDFFLTRPYERFAITQRPDIETAVSLFVVGLAVTELAARSRRHRSAATQEAGHVGQIYALAELAAQGAPAESVIDRATEELTELLHLRACSFVQGPGGHGHAEIYRDGSVHLGTIRWGAHEMGLPGHEVQLRAYNQGREVGRFVMEPTPGWPVSVQQRLVAVAIADQVGAAFPPRLRLA
jgi:K+-sensing histidine kinase KdpD